VVTSPIAVDISVGHLGVAALCAVIAAFSYALSNVLQQHEAEQLAQDETLKLGLLAKLAHRPRWLVGMGADVGGYVFEALALGIGTLVLVEPILATSLLLSLFLGAVINHRHISRVGWGAAVVLALGVSCFLMLVAPTRGTDIAPEHSWLIAAPPIIAFVLGCIVAARSVSESTRAALLGLAAGVLFGTSAVLTKAFVHYLGNGILDWVPHWEPYALAVSSITGLVLSQSAFQTGGLAAAVGAEQVMQPITGVALGMGLLGERLGISGPIQKIALLAALFSMVWGVLTLARVEHTSDRPVDAAPSPALADGLCPEA
jgi:drug/metabolite transporter (DMT)-like permease